MMNLLSTIRAAVFPLLIFLVLFMLELFLLLSMNSGHFIYTLDDPYIHLRLAQNIFEGHYGINPAEYSSPSSSILWPFLLAPFSHFSFAEYVPLIINLIASLGTLLVVSVIVGKVINSEKVIGILVSLFIPAANLLAITFTGMEHSLQIFLAVVIIAGLIVELETGEVPWWLLLGLILGPLVRYEALSLTIVSVGYLAYRRKFVYAGLTGFLTLMIIAGFSWFLSSLNLELLPNSVLAKSQIHSTIESLPTYILTIWKNLLTRQGTVLLGGFLLLGITFYSNFLPSKEKAFAAWTSIILLIHFCLVPIGGNRFHRYDLYVFATTILGTLYLYRYPLRRIFESHSKKALAGYAMMFLLGVSFPFLGHTLVTPLASNNIYEQQYQMQIFSQEHYRQPVAVNDLGLVSYGSNHYVLDLWGLGSSEALKERQQNSSGEWMDRLAKKHQVHLAMIYDRWFPNIPENWIRLATLHLGKTNITPADSMVSIYVMDQASIISAKAALHSFTQNLPTGVRLELEKDGQLTKVQNHKSEVPSLL